MDRETVIESIVEIAERGSYSCFAVEQLESELSRCGYEMADRGTIVEVSLQAGAERDPRKFASALYELLESRAAANFLDSADSLYAACLMCRS